MTHWFDLFVKQEEANWFDFICPSIHLHAHMPAVHLHPMDQWNYYQEV
jgi:hypothetical protein